MAVSDDRDPALERLYRAASTEEPPEHLDAAILAAARREAGSRPRLAGSPFSTAWAVPVSLAAVVVLSVSLVVVMRDEGAGDVSTPVRSEGLRRQDTGPQVKPPGQASPASAQPLPEAAPEVRQEADRSDAARARGPSASGETGAASRETRVHPSEPATEARADTERSKEARTESAADQAPARANEAPAALSGLAKRSSPGPAAPPLAAPNPSAPSAVEPAPPAVSTSPAVTERRTEEVAPKVLQRQEVMRAAPAAKPASPAADRAAASESRENLAPDEWLARIERLKREGRDAEAAASLEAFRKRYPDYPIPAALK